MRIHTSNHGCRSAAHPLQAGEQGTPAPQAPSRPGWGVLETPGDPVGERSGTLPEKACLLVNHVTG